MYKLPDVAFLQRKGEHTWYVLLTCSFVNGKQNVVGLAGSPWIPYLCLVILAT